MRGWGSMEECVRKSECVWAIIAPERPEGIESG